jgi:ABC-type dipeptide/oligopeptide/nickel transport system permease component
MWAYIIRRLLVISPTLFFLSLLIFLIVRVIPGDPAQIMAGEYATKENVELIRKQLGLDRPLHVQYIDFIARLLKGDLGRSIRTTAPVLEELKGRYVNTLILTFVSMAIAFAGGILAGIISAIKWNTWIDNLVMIGAMLGRFHASLLARPLIDPMFLSPIGVAALGRQRIFGSSCPALRYLGYPLPPRSLPELAGLACLMSSSKTMW